MLMKMYIIIQMQLKKLKKFAGTYTTQQLSKRKYTTSKAVLKCITRTIRTKLIMKSLYVHTYIH